MSYCEDERAAEVAEIARQLPNLTGQLGRLIWRHAKGALPRGMANVLAALGDGPETVGRLAERQGIAQPTLTRMVERLESDGLVRRERHPTDGRAVVVSLTPHGERELTELRGRYLAVLAERLDSLSDQELRALTDATESLAHLIEVLRD